MYPSSSTQSQHSQQHSQQLYSPLVSIIARSTVDATVDSTTVVSSSALSPQGEMDPPSIPPPEDTAASQPTSAAQTPTGREAPSDPELISPNQSTNLPEATNTPRPLPEAEPAPDGPPLEATTTELGSAGASNPSAQSGHEAIPDLGPVTAPEEAATPETTVPGEPSTTSMRQQTPAPTWKPPRSSLFSLPPDLPAMRARFFSLDTPLTLSQAQFNEYWPFMDNMYVKNKERPVTLDNTRSAYFYCRLWKKSEYVGVSSAIRQRKKHSRATIACPVKFKAVFYGDSHVNLERLNDEVHNHNLDYVDSIKRNSAIRNIAAAEVSKGYKPCDVARNLRESSRADNLQALQAAGGAYICLKDVHNAGRLKPSTPQSPG